MAYWSRGIFVDGDIWLIDVTRKDVFEQSPVQIQYGNLKNVSYMTAWFKNVKNVFNFSVKISYTLLQTIHIS
jgi:hypothetical protein